MERVLNSRRLWLLPIEPLPMRYSYEWTHWLTAAFVHLGFVVELVHDDKWSEHTDIRTGEFLDAFQTNRYKSLQLVAMLKHLQDGHVDDGDIVFYMDAWNPTLLQLAYTRSIARRAFRISGFAHAGTWDAHDLLSRVGMGTWVTGLEKSILQVLDPCLVATPFHAKLIERAHGITPIVSGAPFEASYVISGACLTKWENRPMRVVFPHRKAPEKNVEGWEAIKLLYSQTHPEDAVEWVETAGMVKSKAHFYDVLASSRVAVSTAFQETFGIAMVEAATLGCQCVVPNRLSYQDVFESKCRYNSNAQAVARIHAMLHAWHCPPSTELRWCDTKALALHFLKAVESRW